jgi:hypothetical protein
MKQNLLTRKLVVSAIALITVASAALAQFPGGQGGPGGPGGAGGPGRRGPGGPGMMAGPGLFMAPGVRQELQLSDAQVEQIREIIEANRPQRGPGNGGPGQGGRPSHEEMEKRRQAFESKLQGVLSANQFRRYTELSLQAQGAPAVLRSDMSAKLKLSANQRSAIENILEQSRPSGGPGGRPGMGGPGQGGPGFGKREELDAKILAVLSVGQREQWQALQGKKFDFRPRGE